MYLYECIVHTIETFWQNAHAHSYPFYCTAFRRTHSALWRNDREEKKCLIIVGLALRFRVYAWRNALKHSKKICTHCRPFSLTPHLHNMYMRCLQSPVACRLNMKVHQTLVWLNLLSFGTKDLTAPTIGIQSAANHNTLFRHFVPITPACPVSSSLLSYFPCRTGPESPNSRHSTANMPQYLILLDKLM